MIYILFGEMGVGKNYIGKRLAVHLKCQFMDGDDELPYLLKKKVERFEPFTLDEVDDFVRKNLIPQIEGGAFWAGDNDIVVAQALYRQEHRDIIENYFSDIVTWIHVTPPSFIEHIRRLFKRIDGFRWVLFGLVHKPFFQKPRPSTIKLCSIKGISIDEIGVNFAVEKNLI